MEALDVRSATAADREAVAGILESSWRAPRWWYTQRSTTPSISTRA